MKVRVSPYNHDWPTLFEAEAEKISSIFKEQLITIHHIGSTSVAGLQAKPIIDMMPVLKNITAADRLAFRMKKLGYEALGEYGLPGRRYFRKGKEKRTHHVHMYDLSSQEEIYRHVAVRDYLRAHQEEAEAYGKLKQKLSKAHHDDMEAYINGKDQFVKDLESKAMEWRLKYKLLQ
ncbi:GrpB family protein [Jeotgalibacillus malaysiensis]|uniref:GrpB family protein n=1 Tax=Jeotgalibacillus malaysiensis TaxID=1508404 RepID=UPI00384A8701